MIRDLLQRFANDRYDAVRRPRYLKEACGFDRSGWTTLAETGLLAAPLGEAWGGLGRDNATLITMMETIGRHAMVEPVIPVLLLGARLIERAATPVQQEALLPAIAAGTGFVAMAHVEHAARFVIDAVAVTARSNGEAAHLDGAKRLVLGGPFADRFIVSARGNSGVVGLYLVDAAATGISRRDYRLADGSPASDLDFHHTPGAPMAGGIEAIVEAIADARLAIAAELLGLMGLLFDDTLDYLKTRTQFGQPLGSFQAIQHRMAEGYSQLELSRSQLYRAAAAEGRARPAAIAGAKAFISTAARRIGEEAVQFHGGMGTTEELMVGQAFKRVMLLSALFGDPDWELREYARLCGEAEAESGG